VYGFAPLVLTAQNKFNNKYQTEFAYMLHSSDPSDRCFVICPLKLSSITPIELSSMIFSVLSSKSKLAFGTRTHGATAVQRTASFPSPTLIFLQIYFPML
jgi:hypothetical protein